MKMKINVKRVLRYLALLAICYGLGAGAAWLSNRGNGPATPSPANKTAPAVTVDSTGKIVIDKDKLAASDKKMSETDKKLAEALSGTATQSVKPDAKDEKKETAKTAPAVSDSLTGVEGTIANETLTGEPAATPEKKKQATTVIEPSTLKPTGVGEGYFSLIDQDGNPVTEKSWPGKYLLVFFGFTHCPDICPVTLQKISAVIDKLGSADAAKMQTLFITVDPERDTPDVMKQYVSNFDKSILGLTGTVRQVKDAEDDFKVYAAKVPDKDGKGYSYNHSGFAYLMSPKGKMVELLKIEDGTETFLKKIKPHLENPTIDDGAPAAPILP